MHARCPHTNRDDANDPMPRAASSRAADTVPPRLGTWTETGATAGTHSDVICGCGKAFARPIHPRRSHTASRRGAPTVESPAPRGSSSVRRSRLTARVWDVSMLGDDTLDGSGVSPHLRKCGSYRDSGTLQSVVLVWQLQGSLPLGAFPCPGVRELGRTLTDAGHSQLAWEWREGSPAVRDTPPLPGSHLGKPVRLSGQEERVLERGMLFVRFRSVDDKVRLKIS